MSDILRGKNLRVYNDRIFSGLAYDEPEAKYMCIFPIFPFENDGTFVQSASKNGRDYQLNSYGD